MAIKKVSFQISGMTCGHCEKRVAGAAMKLKGVKSATASFPKKQAIVQFDEEAVSAEKIKNAIENEGYAVKNADGAKHPASKVAPIFLMIAAAYFILKYTVGFDFVNLIPKIDATVSLIALFTIGILTSVHCIAMCGGINLSQSVGSGEGNQGKLKRPLLYNLGRVVSYTAIGGIVGGVGSVLFISVTVKGVIMLAAAIFMVLMGLSMLGWIPHWLVPRLPGKMVVDTAKTKKGKGPFVVGLLNGLLPCGPLQAMQIYALSTGSILMGALSMFLFSLGTLPLMLGAGFVFSLLKGRFSRGITRVSAALIILIAVVMFTNAGGLFGWNLGMGDDSGTVQAAVQSQNGETQAISGYQIARIKDGVQVVDGDLASGGYPNILVQKGIPVQFNLKATDDTINGCNGTVVINQYNIQKELAAGDNIMEFTPAESGTVPYSCWMGMIHAKILVVDDLNNITFGGTSAAASSAPGNQSAGSSVSGGGGCCAGGSQATKFAGGKIPTDEVQVATVVDGVQEVTVGVNDQGYTPAVLVVQKGVETKIKFNAEKLNSCNYIITFPEYNGSLDLSKGETETPVLTPEADFTFQCGMGMLHGYVKVVDDLSNINLDQIKSEVAAYKPASGGGCCGG